MTERIGEDTSAGCGAENVAVGGAERTVPEKWQTTQPVFVVAWLALELS